MDRRDRTGKVRKVLFRCDQGEVKLKIYDLRNIENAKLEYYMPKKKVFSYNGMEVVAKILERVREEGDRALSSYTLRFDGCEIKNFRVTEGEFEEARAMVSEKLKCIVKEAAENIRLYHKNQIVESWSFSPREGVQLGQNIKPINRVGLYIPGGKAAYPSTVLMNAIPAQLAGVNEITVFTPPSSEGKISPLVLYTADLLGIKEVYKVGGAQAVGAAAYGTEQIRAVDKIVGPGNKYVAMAKKLVFGDVAIDMIAGPSEVLVVADKTAKACLVAADLLAQAEHDEEAGLFLVTEEKNLIREVEKELIAQLELLPKKGIAEKAIENNFSVYLTRDLAQGIEISNLIAPEHLELMIENPFETLPMINQAGAVFLGAYTPEALGDYFAGTNHTLPTSGTARFSSPLGVYDFIKRPSFLYYSKEALGKVSEKVAAFAEAEGLDAHRNSVLKRLEAME